MQRVNSHSFYQLGSFLHALSEIKEGDKLHQHLFSLAAARNWLTWFLSDRVIPINVCKNDGWKLLNAINVLVPEDFPKNSPEDRPLTWSEAYDVTNNLRNFETVMSAELQNCAVYFVSKKSIYETADLIERAENVLPEEIKRDLTSQNISDLKEAGKCIAFNLPTAAGFHVMRAIEPVLLDWHRFVVKQDPTQKNWGTYLQELKKANANPDVMAVLNQIRSIHRNPVMHPEVILTIDEAIDLFDIGKAAIRAMVVEIQKLKSQQSVGGASTIIAALTSAAISNTTVNSP